MFIIQPLTFFSLKTASIIWFFLNQIFLFLALYLIAKCFKRTKLNLNDWILILVVANFYFPIYKVFKTGQADIVLLLFFILAFTFYLKKKIFWGGLIIALFSLIKPFYLIFVPWLFLKKKIKPLFYSFIILLALNAFLIVSTDINQNLVYYKKVLPKLINYGVTSNYKSAANSTIHGFIYRNFDKNKQNNSLMDLSKKQLKGISLVMQILVLLAAILLLLYKNKQSFELMTLDFSFLLACFFLLQKYIHFVYLIFLLLPFFCCFYLALKLRKNLLIILLGASFVLVGYAQSISNFFVKTMPSTLFFDFRIYGQILLLGILIYLMLYFRKFSDKLTITNNNENSTPHQQILAANQKNQPFTRSCRILK